MPEKVTRADLKSDMCFESRVGFGESRLVSIFVGLLHFGNYLQGCIAEL